MELAAYAGLALVVVGPIWYWIVHPVKAYLESEGGQPSGETDAALESNADGGFEFGNQGSDKVSTTASDGMDPLTAEFDRVVPEPRRGRPPAWASILFDGGELPSVAFSPQAVPEGDFLRSPGGTETDRDDPPSNVTLEDILVQPGNDQPDEVASAPEQTGVETMEVVSNGGAREHDLDHGPSQNESSGEGREASNHIDLSSEAEAEGAAADRTSEEAANRSEPDAEPKDPVEAIRVAVENGREKVNTVSGRLVQPSMDSNVTATESDIADICRRTEAFTRSLHGEIPDDGQSIREEVESIRRDQARIESAFESLFGD